MKKKNIIIISSLILVLILIISLNSYLFISIKKSRPVFVNTAVLISGFNYAKELDQMLNNDITQMQNTLNQISHQIDSLSSMPNLSNDNKIKCGELELLYKQKEELFYQESVELKKKYNSLIIERINQYIFEYGEKEGLFIILGANGDGNIMYAKESIDITDEVLSYINERYEGE